MQLACESAQCGGVFEVQYHARPEPSAAARPRVKVLMVASWYPSSAQPSAGTFIRDQALELSRSVDVAVLHVDDSATDPYVHMEAPDGFPVVRVGALVRRAGRSLPARLVELHDRTRGLVSAGVRGARALETAWGTPELVHAQVLYPGGLIARVLAGVYGTPYVVTEHATEFTHASGVFATRNRTIRRMMKRAARDAFAVMPVSESLAIAMRDCGIEANYCVIPNMVRGGAGVPSVQVRRQVVSVSLMNDEAKNISALLRACSAVSEHGALPFKLVLVGDGRDRSNLEALAVQLGLGREHVWFTGRKSQEETLDIIRESAFLVTASRFETFSLATAEALMCGRPVVATACGGPEEFVTDQVGIVIPVDDDIALEQAMERMLKEYPNYDPSAIAAYASSLFAPSRVAERITAIYRAALGTGGPS